jgi:hypothetical protein
MNDDFNVDDLVNGWKYQDQFEAISMKLIEAGIQLGVRATGLEFLKSLVVKDVTAFTEDELKKLLDASYDNAVKMLKERMKNARGA